ncbi:unnamed protein product, partial [Symbiodinium pilosum]
VQVQAPLLDPQTVDCSAVRRTEPTRSDGPPILEEAWLKVLSYFSPADLCHLSPVHAKLHALASDEDTWKSQCTLRWRGKQWMKAGELFRNGDYTGLKLSVAECKSLLRRRGVNGLPHITEKAELLHALHETNPHVAGARRKAATIPCKWKRSYAYAELDSKRSHITHDEVAHFRWRLVYHGRPSSMGL